MHRASNAVGSDLVMPLISFLFPFLFLTISRAQQTLLPYGPLNGPCLVLESLSRLSGLYQYLCCSTGHLYFSLSFIFDSYLRGSKLF
ncbi:hypothetical protein J3A83DRAFT_4219988 [Scleroderma citrinum]